jgi:hypothetical protein
MTRGDLLAAIEAYGEASHTPALDLIERYPVALLVGLMRARAERNTTTDGR